jgi:hypothetical protein
VFRVPLVELVEQDLKVSRVLKVFKVLLAERD